MLILDEPTAVLTPQEALRPVPRHAHADADSGTGIIFITHKLREVLDVADRITVLRQGKVVGTVPPREATGESLAAMMVGRPVLLRVDKAPAQPGDVGAAGARPAGAVRSRRCRRSTACRSRCAAGEILGIAGVQGNGQTELVEALTGLRTPVGGPLELGRAT